MEYTSELRVLKSQLEQLLINKENHLLQLNKRANDLKSQKQSQKYAALEKECASEEIRSASMQKGQEYVEKLKLERELREQLAYKEAEKGSEKAEDLIQSLTLKALDQSYENSEKIDKKQDVNKEFEEFYVAQRHLKEIQKNKETAQNCIIDCTAEQRDLVKTLRDEVENQKKQTKDLERNLVQARLGFNLKGASMYKEELRDLRKEEECWKMEQEEEKRMNERKEREKERNQRVLDEREKQLQLREEMKILESQRDKAYVNLLVELLAEEERLERLQAEVRRRKQLEHRVVAQKVLEERRKRRKELMRERNQSLKEEQDLNVLRKSVLEEEEKKLLLQYLPHLGPLLTSQVLERFSSL